MDQTVQNELPEQPASQPEQTKRPWRKPEIVNVGGVLDLTEAVGGNLNDGSSGSMMVTYWK